MDSGNNNDKQSQIEEEGSCMINVETENTKYPRFYKDVSPSFDSYATQKTIAHGFFNVTLITTNFTDMKRMIDSDKWTVTNILTFTVICIILVIQFVIAVLLIRLGKTQEITEIQNQNMKKKRRTEYEDDKKFVLPHNNNLVTLLTALITVLNIFVSIFSA